MNNYFFILLFSILPLRAMEFLPNGDIRFVAKSKLKLYETLGVAKKDEANDCVLLITGARSARFNGVLHCSSNSGQIMASAPKIVERFKKEQVPFSWTVEQSQEPSNMQDILGEHGMSLRCVSPGMVMHLDDVKIPEADQIENFSIIILESNAELSEFHQILRKGFGFDSRTSKIYASLFCIPSQDPDFIHVAGRFHGKMVSIGTILQTPKGGYIYNIATLAENRCHGFARAIICKLLAVAQQKGIERVGLISSQDAAEMYATLGFVQVCMINTYE